MKIIRSYISTLVLILLLFPSIEKAWHDFEQLNEEHCELKDTHYCKVEHNCSLCDYVFGAQSNLQVVQNNKVLYYQLVVTIASTIVFNNIVPRKYTFTLRGPPVKHLFLKFFSVS